MTTTSHADPADLSPEDLDELGALLGPRVDPRASDPRASENGAPPFDVDAVFAQVEQRIEADQRHASSRLREQPTWRRRLLALLAFLVVVATATAASPGRALTTLPAWVIAVQALSLTVLFVLALTVALRPPHLPALAPRRAWLLSGASILATLALALVPGLAHVGFYPDADASYWSHTLPCLLWGLLVGLPIYGALRVLDRGNPLGRLLAALAAGLAANVMLQLHCAMGDLGHILGGHALVLLIYIAGIAATERVVGS